MISMTAYWQQFQEYLNILQLMTGNEEYKKQLTVANQLLALGLTIEQAGITTLLGMSAQLQEKAKQFNNNVEYKANPQYSFYLPSIVDMETLIFAIIYYQHLINYENVSYQGSINFLFKQRAINGTNEKKLSTSIQAKTMRQEIKQYCQKNNLTLAEASLLKKQNESAKEHSLRLEKTLIQPKIQLKTDIDPPDPQQSDKRFLLEKKLGKLTSLSNELNVKISDFATKLSKYNLAKQNYFGLSKQWEDTWAITKAIYWLVSFVFKVTLIRDLDYAKETFNITENAVNQELPASESKESYGHELESQLEQTNIERGRMEERIAHQVKLNEIKEEQIKLAKMKTPEQTKPHMLPPLEQKPVLISILSPITQQPTANNSSFNLSCYYGFFRDNMPCAQTLTAALVGAAAIAIQNL